MATVEIQELPRKDGFPIGQYRLRYSTITVTMFDAEIVDGVTVAPISGRTLQRLRSAYGCECIIEPWDDETRELIAVHLESVGQGARATALRAGGDASVVPAALPPELPVPAAPPPVAERATRAGASVRPVDRTDSIDGVEPMIDQDVDHITDLNVLRSIATALGVDVDGHWKASRLRVEIRRARDAR